MHACCPDVDRSSTRLSYRNVPHSFSLSAYSVNNNNNNNNNNKNANCRLLFKRVVAESCVCSDTRRISALHIGPRSVHHVSLVISLTSSSHMSDNIWGSGTMLVWRIRGKIVTTVLCCVVLLTTSVHKNMHTHARAFLANYCWFTFFVCFWVFLNHCSLFAFGLAFSLWILYFFEYFLLAEFGC